MSKKEAPFQQLLILPTFDVGFLNLVAKNYQSKKKKKRKGETHKMGKERT